jgi:hypothetical protein
VDLREIGGRVWNWFIWLKTGTSSKLLWPEWHTFGPASQPAII